MSLASLSIERPTFITCIVILMVALGLLSASRLGVELFPDVTFPVVTVNVPYPGAGPHEVETLVSKPLEDELSTLSGIKRVSSLNSEGLSRVIIEFTLETDVKFAEQQVRDRVGSARPNLPIDIKEPTIRRLDPADQPIVMLGLEVDAGAEVTPAKLFDLADELIRPRLEQINQVGQVDIQGGRKREIQILLDRKKLKAHELSVSAVATRLGLSGMNVPSGKVEQGTKTEMVFRMLGEYPRTADISKTVVSFYGSDVPTTIQQVGRVSDALEDERDRAYLGGAKSLFLSVYKQSGANTIAVVDALRARLVSLNAELKSEGAPARLSIIRDGSLAIRNNVDDVYDSIYLGAILAVVVVFFFLANLRSTLITGLALPNSLIGAFILMAAAKFTINIMTLLALSLSVGLLIDDAIVVRENIFRHIEQGKKPIPAALEGTAEVSLAVIATTLTVIAVFGPVAFLKGMVGQFFKEFGLTICFAMAISLFDALTIAPMLSAYFAGQLHRPPRNILYRLSVGALLQGFERFQSWLERGYERLIRFGLRHPAFILSLSLVVFIGSASVVRFVPKTFLPPQDDGEFSVSLDLPPGTSLGGMSETALKVDAVIRQNPEVQISALTVGGTGALAGHPERADFYVKLVGSRQRSLNTQEFKEQVRGQLRDYAYANPQVQDYDAIGGGQRPFILNIQGFDQEELEAVGRQVFAKLKNYPGLKDVDTSVRPGKPEFQISLDANHARRLGISSVTLGNELRAQVEGVTPLKFREHGREYDIRVRVDYPERDLKKNYAAVYVPNLNNDLVRLSDVAHTRDALGPSTIYRQDRNRYVEITAELAPGAGMAQIMEDVSRLFEHEIPLKPGMRQSFKGQAENFAELVDSIKIAMGLAILFIFMVLASLYESFVTPLTIMLALPLAICGSLFALYITHQSLNIFSMIGCIMLLGVATKNSILLVDYANHLLAQGLSRSEAIVQAGRTRLRPILMTTMALIAGTIPVALGLSEASRQRKGMGIAIIGGLVSSTILTLIVIPAVFSYLDRYRVWSKNWLHRWSSGTQ